jgi:hypothetical protein
VRERETTEQRIVFLHFELDFDCCQVIYNDHQLSSPDFVRTTVFAIQFEKTAGLLKAEEAYRQALKILTKSSKKPTNKLCKNVIDRLLILVDERFQLIQKLKQSLPKSAQSEASTLVAAASSSSSKKQKQEGMWSVRKKKNPLIDRLANNDNFQQLQQSQQSSQKQTNASSSLTSSQQSQQSKSPEQSQHQSQQSKSPEQVHLKASKLSRESRTKALNRFPTLKNISLNGNNNQKLAKELEHDFTLKTDQLMKRQNTSIFKNSRATDLQQYQAQLQQFLRDQINDSRNGKVQSFICSN